MGSERDASRKQRRSPALGIGNRCGRAERQKCHSRRPDERVDRLPDRIDIRNLVRQEFQQIKDRYDSQHHGMGEDAEVGRAVE